MTKRRSSDTIDDVIRQDIDVILLDIEGTTTSIKFVKDVLFPYAVTEAAEHLRTTWHQEETIQDVRRIRQQIIEDGQLSASQSPQETRPEEHKDGDDGEKDLPVDLSTTPADAASANPSDAEVEEIVSAVRRMVAADRKIPCLKTFQGHIWRRGYEHGALKGHIYPDVPDALDRWHSSGLRLYVYSSGSVEAQRLLFGHSEYGDLNKYFSGNYDTGSGQKRDADSYRTIVKDIGVPAERVLFVTDIIAEAAAASSAGMEVAVSCRPGNAPLDREDRQKYACVNSFETIIAATKHKKKSQ